MSDIFKKRDIDNTVLSQIEFLQLFSLNDLSLSLENLGALLATGTNNAGLVIIEDISAIDINWASNQSKDFTIPSIEADSFIAKYLVEIIKSLSRLGCCIVIQHSISKSDMDDTRKFEYYWNPMIDLRLCFSKIENKLSIEIMKSRQKVSMNDKKHLIHYEIDFYKVMFNRSGIILFIFLLLWCHCLYWRQHFKTT